MLGVALCFIIQSIAPGTVNCTRLTCSSLQLAESGVLTPHLKCRGVVPQDERLQDSMEALRGKFKAVAAAIGLHEAYFRREAAAAAGLAF